MEMITNCVELFINICLIDILKNQLTNPWISCILNISNTTVGEMINILMDQDFYSVKWIIVSINQKFKDQFLKKMVQ